MSILQSLIETFLTESVALTKGSQRVMNDKNLVANLADAMRDDARSHPSAFPPGSNRSFQKAPDEELAQWFLENIDKIERDGYEDVVYSRDGVNSEWIVRRYIAGSHNWEDITGVMAMNLADWYALKNRNMLDPNHKDLLKFNSVRDVGFYMTTHYKDSLEKLRDATRNAARNKMAKSVKLVDNDDYRIYSTLNRAAGCALGLGTQWCTANSSYGGHFHNYSNRAMLFQLFPYEKEQSEDGKRSLNQHEKYQFDAGGPNFMDVIDRPARPEDIRGKFPYLYTDLVNALKEKKPDLEKAFKDLAEDPKLQGDDYKVKVYNIDDEINKLGKFASRGYFTDEVRPKEEKPDPDAEQAPQIQTESLSDLVYSMLEDKYTKELDDEDEVPNKELDAEFANNELGTMGTGTGPAAGGKYQQGTAPTMPESLNYKGTIMKNVDKDVAAMLQSLKKYDTLTESVAPVLMARPSVVNEDEKEKNPWMDLAKKDKESSGKTTKTASGLKHERDYDSKAKKSTGDEELDEALRIMSQIAESNGIISEEDEEDKEVDEACDMKEEDDNEDINESADKEVLEWMQRFSKLGNMKGYGR